MPAVAVAPAHRRHDISDRVWEILEPLLPEGQDRPAGPRCRFINAVFWSAPAPPGGIPPDYVEEHPPPLLPLAGPEQWIIMNVMLDASYIKIPTAPGPGAATKPLPAQKGAHSKLHLGLECR